MSTTDWNNYYRLMVTSCSMWIVGFIFSFWVYLPVGIFMLVLALVCAGGALLISLKGLLGKSDIES